MSLRLSGLASGMDTESMIKELMKAEKLKVDKVEKKKVALEWKKEVWQGFNTKLLAFYNNDLFNGKLSKTFSSKKAISSSSILSASASATAPVGSHKFKVNQMAKGVSIMSKKLEKAGGETLKESDKISDLAGLPAGIGDINILVNGQSIDIKMTGADDEKTTMGQLISKINAVEGVKASYDSANGRIFVSSLKTGADVKLEIKPTSVESENVINQIFGGVIEEDGVNAKVEYLGEVMEFNSNSISINGINLELQGASTTEEINVTITDDTDKTVENIKDFVKAYNSLLAEGNKLLYAEPVKKYEALTEEEYKALDEETRKTWKEKVQSDMLRGDSDLRGLIDKLRSTVSSSGIYQKLSSMGITTGLYTERGKLVINEDKLVKAVKKDPEGAKQVFNDLSDNMYEDVKKRIKRTTMSSALTLYNDKQLDKDIKDYKSRMSTLLEKMQVIEDRYYSQFAKMESMMSKMNNQRSSLAGLLGG